MAQGNINKQTTNERHSIKYIWDPQKGAQLSDPVHAGNDPKAATISSTCVDQTHSNNTQTLSTGQLVCAIGQIWGYAAHPISAKNSTHNKELSLDISQSNGLIGLSSESDKSQEHIVGNPRPKLQSEPDVSAFCVDVVGHGSSSPIGSGNIMGTKFLDEKVFSSVYNSKELRNVYNWMSHRYSSRNNMSYQNGISMLVDSNAMDLSVQNNSNSCLPSHTEAEKVSVTVNEVRSRIRTNVSNPAVINQTTLSPFECSKQTVSSINGTNFHREDWLVPATNATKQSTHLAEATCTETLEESSEKINDRLIDRQILQADELDLTDMETKVSSATCSKSQISPAKQQHAVAGAMAGICVSLCLHPVDTVKTLVQSCHLDKKSICDIGRSVVSERGLSGLYRGIASNIASSAPISAVYTFTYESVKGVLLPLFPKEYCSVAHCIAGGCASVATSFIFTPSECIKQQMQVRSYYPNCWSALIGVIQKGGLASLYAGWGAVLCRNVPHSIIKFYAYENLKQSMMATLECNELDSLQTLVCGGVAGSTAALFSTPFDVVKTRLQTQIPGTENRYRGVFQAVQEIRKSEGFKGLYRGLAPRLIMYMTQGGLFFASYEFFKELLV